MSGSSNETELLSKLKSFKQRVLKTLLSQDAETKLGKADANTPSWASLRVPSKKAREICDVAVRWQVAGSIG